MCYSVDGACALSLPHFIQTKLCLQQTLTVGQIALPGDITHAIISRLDGQTRFAVADARRTNLSSWGRELLRKTVLEEDRAIRLRNTLMHQRAIAVPVNVCHEALVWRVPGYLADIVTGARPAFETLEVAPHIHCHVVVHHVDNCIPQTCSFVEVDWIV